MGIRHSRSSILSIHVKMLFRNYAFGLVAGENARAPRIRPAFAKAVIFHFRFTINYPHQNSRPAAMNV